MPVNSDPHPYTKDSLFVDAMVFFQTGQWQAGQQLIKQVMERYPASYTQLQKISTEMAVRAHIDHYEVEETRHVRAQRLRKIVLYGLIGLALSLVLFYIIGTYAGVLQTQVERVQAELEEQNEYLTLLSTYRNAQNLYRAGRAIAAVSLFDQVHAQITANEYPNEADTFVNLDLELEQARKVAELEGMYDRALEFLSQNRYSEALILLEEIKIQDPRYRDVQQQIDQLNVYFEMETVFERANAAAAVGEWATSIELYENLRNQDPEFRASEIEDSLFQAYLSNAQAILDQEETMEQLEIAEKYFAKALAMRPQDPSTVELRRQARRAVEDALIRTYLNAAEQALLYQEDSLAALDEANEYYYKASQVRPDDPTVALNYEMARRYLSAIENFNRSLWDTVIEQLEFVYVEDPNFAKGTSAQTLYDAYLARGGKLVTAGDYETALEDFKRAGEIANYKEDAVLLVIQAETEMARTLGMLGRYAEAVAIYQDAVLKGSLAERARRANQDVYYNLINAEASLEAGNLKTAYNYYRAAMINLNDLLISTTHMVTEGEYITSLARQYNTTVEAILEANNLTSRRIEADQELIIPTLDD